MKCLIFKHENAVLVGQNRINAGISKCLAAFHRQKGGVLEKFVMEGQAGWNSIF